MNTRPRISLPGLLTLLRRFEFPRKLGALELVFGRSLARHGICWVETAARIPWKLNLSEPTDRWIVYGKYEGAGFLDWAAGFLPSGGVVVDSGANIGQMLLYTSQMVPKGKLLAFEPGKEQADWLEDCLAANPHLPVELIRSGLGEQGGYMYLSNDGDLSKHGAQNRISDSGSRLVPLCRLEDELTNRSLDHVDLWKLDVEGFEIPALRGAGSFLKAKRIHAIYCELSGDNGVEIFSFLQSLGYNCYLFRRGGALHRVGVRELPGHTNGLFMPPTRI
jgi:FkbM family methyltransferase